MTHQAQVTHRRGSARSTGSSTSCARAASRSSCWPWSPTRWWRSCSTTRRAGWCSATGFLLGYLLFSAVCSTVAFALFEICTIFQLHDLMSLDASIKVEIGAEKLIKRGWFVLGVSSLINFVSVLYFLALAWHTSLGHVGHVPAGQPAAAVELALLRPACPGLHRRAVPGGHLRRAAQVRERSRPRHATGAGAAGVGTLAAAEGSADRADDARRHPARRGGRCPRLTRDRRAHRPDGGGHQWQHVGPRCRVPERQARRP